MTKAPHRLTSLLHRLGVAHPARVRVVGGSGAPRVGLAPVLLVSAIVMLGVALFGAASASAEELKPWWGMTAGTRPTDLRPGLAKSTTMQLTVEATEGEYTLKENGAAATIGADLRCVAWNASAATVRGALEEIYAGKIEVTGAGPGETSPYTLTFPGQVANAIQEPGLGGGVPGSIEASDALVEFKLAPFYQPQCPTANGNPLQNGLAKGRVSLTQTAVGAYDGQVIVDAQNRGDGPTPVGATTTVAGHVPAGLEAVAIEGTAGGTSNHGNNRGPVVCKLSTLTCTFGPYEGEFEFHEPVLPPYEQIEVRISVVVKGSAHSGEQVSGTVSGGGAASAASVSHAIEVNGTERFGVEDWQLIPEEAGGRVDTQAGSHPFQVTNITTFNSGRPDQKGFPQAFDQVKDVVGELPVGFIGNPTPFTQCTDAQFSKVPAAAGIGTVINECPAQSAVGSATVTFTEPKSEGFDTVTAPIFNMKPLAGEPARFAFKAEGLIPAFLDASVRTGRDYGVTITSSNIIQIASLLSVKLTFWGVPGEPSHDQQRGWECMEHFGSCPTSTSLTPPPFLVMPTSCGAPFQTTVHADSWGSSAGASQEAEPVTYSLPEKVDGCNRLPFNPSIEVTPDVKDTSTSSGLNVKVHLPQIAALNPEGLAESALRSTTVTLPAGVAVNPSGANGLEACSANPGDLSGGRLGTPGDQIGYTGNEELDKAGEPEVKTATFTGELPESFHALGAVESHELEKSEETLSPGFNFCPNASKIGEVTIESPLLPPNQPVKGFVYLADQNANPFGSLVAMYAVAEDPISGTVIKLPFNVSLNPSTGQLVATSENSPELPFENAEFHFFGGERAPLATPSRCGSYTTTASLTPWSGNPPSSAQSTFDITSGPNGGPCTYPGQALPFSPTLTGGATNLQAGAFSPFTATMSRKDGEQNLQSLEVHLPPGLSGILTGVELCPEPQADEGKCGENSKIGESTVSVGVGGDPFSVTGGKFYLTGPYNGTGGCGTPGANGCAPFGVTFEVPAKAGPFDLERNSANPAGEDACDCVVVRGKIEIDPHTAAITIVSNPPGTPYSIPTSIEGIPLEIQHVNATTTRGNFQFNPTNCNKMAVTGTIHSSEGGADTIAVPFQVTNCATLKFAPKFSVSTSGKTSKAKGASLTAKLSEPAGAQGTQANITRVKVDLPKQLPSRLTTLQKACTNKQFELNPANCPKESKIGYAVVYTPLLPVPLEGPAIFVSHGGEAFPSLTMVLQGYGVTVDLVGTTFISKAGITSTTFKTVPDVPFNTFQLTLPQGKFSALAANVPTKDHYSLCGQSLTMPTEFVAQNGAKINESTKVSVTGCAKKATKNKKKHHKRKKSTHGKRSN